MKTKTPTGSGNLSSGALADAAGVSVDSLRHYERKGLLAAPRRLSNGYRSYSPESLSRVILIQNALAVGFGLDELLRILQARDRGVAPCHQVRALAVRKLEDLERQIEALNDFRETLRRTLADWDRRLKKQKDGEPVRLLESLTLRTGELPGAAPHFRGARFDRRKRRKENP
jgi:DNA-binding transcriptional MerR regulator